MILIPVLYVVGVGLRKSRIPNKKIPLLLGILSVVLSALWVITTSDIGDVKDCASALFMAVTQGVLCAGASVYVNQLYKQARKEE